MRVKITLLRDHGTPVPEKDQKTVEGVLIYEDRQSLGYVAALVAPEDRSFANLVQPLVSTFLADVKGNTFLLSGLEAENGTPKSMGPLCLQQWKVEPLPPVKKPKKGETPAPETEDVEEVEA